ncbi:hypothetical protein [Falsiroseomonas sp.]|uniref:hypothetical protein n=1 Tax=Falsiroseomonas sp. TaxID=2870721 RepID=UPI003F720F62
MDIPARNLPDAGDEDGWWEVTPGERFTIRTSIAKTGGRYTMLEIVAAPRNGVPIHLHGQEEEHFLVLEASSSGSARGNWR